MLGTGPVRWNCRLGSFFGVSLRHQSRIDFLLFPVRRASLSEHRRKKRAHGSPVPPKPPDSFFPYADASERAYSRVSFPSPSSRLVFIAITLMRPMTWRICVVGFRKVRHSFCFCTTSNCAQFFNLSTQITTFKVFNMIVAHPLNQFYIQQWNGATSTLARQITFDNNGIPCLVHASWRLSEKNSDETKADKAIKSHSIHLCAFNGTDVALTKVNVSLLRLTAVLGTITWLGNEFLKALDSLGLYCI